MVGLLATCSERGAGPQGDTSGAKVNVRMLKTSLSQAVAGVALRAIVEDEIVHQDTTTIVNGRFDFPDFSLPVGPALIIVEAFDENGVIIYSAQSDVQIVIDRTNSVELELLPAVPMARLSPYFSEIETGARQSVILALHNIARFREGTFAIEFDDDVVRYYSTGEVDGQSWGSLSWQSTSTPTRYELTISRSSTDDEVPAGATGLIRITFHGFAPGQAGLDLSVVRMIDDAGSIVELPNLVVDDASISVTGPADEVLDVDPQLDSLLRDLLDLDSDVEIYASDVESLADLDASGRGITDLSGLERMTGLDKIDLSNNDITDLTPLIDNPGLGNGDTVVFKGNPITEQTQQQIDELRNRGVIVVISPAFSGTVTDAMSGDPLAGVLVSLSGASNRSAMSDANGQFLITNIIEGAYNVDLTLNGYEAISDTLTLVDDDVSRDYEMEQVVVRTTIAGTVTSAGDAMTPIAGAMVILSGETAGQTSTDAQGHYQFDNVPPGFYSIVVSADGYQTVNRSFTVEPGKPEVQDFVLSLLLYELSGTVTDGVTSQPIAGAAVAIDGPVSDNTTTDSQGQYSFTGLPPGQYDLDVTANLYEPQSFVVTIVDSDTVQNAALTPIPQTTTISGTVRDDAQSPISGATVTLSGPVNRQTTTDTQGQFEFADVPAGGYTLGASAPGYTSDSRGITAVAGVPLTGEDFTLSKLVYSISGTVTDSVTGDAIAFATIDLSGPDSQSTATNRSGQYSFGDLPAGQYTITVTADTYIGKSRNVTISTSSLTEDFVLAPVSVTTTLSGIVAEGPSGSQPIVGATIVLSGTANGQTTTDAQGFYEFANIPEGDYTIDVTADGYVGEQRAVIISGADPVVENFILSLELFTLTGTVSEGSGATIPIPNATVAVVGPVDTQTTTDAQGTYTISDLPGGEYEMTVSAPGFVTQNRTITVEAPDPVVEDFVLVQEVFTISGFVHDAATQDAISGATVTLQGPVTRNGTSSSLGVYQLSDVPSGTYTITVSAAGYATVVDTVTVAGASITVNFLLSNFTTTISGTIKTTSGLALVGVSVTLTGTMQDSTTTDSAGEYQFSGIQNGSYTLVASLSGFRAGVANVTVAGSPVVQDFVLKASTTVTGMVGLAGGDGVSGATIELVGPENRMATTNAQGFYSITDVVEGEYTGTASLPGFISDTKLISVADVPVVADFTLVPGTIVTGMVTDSMTGAPIAGAEITFDGASDYVTVSAADGTFNLGTIPQGVYAVTIEATNYETKVLSTVTLTATAYFLPVEIAPIVSSMFGIVEDARTGAPIQGATVSLTGPTVGSDVTDIAGGYDIVHLFYGTYTVTVSAPGYITTQATVEIGSGRVYKQFALSPELGSELLRVVLTWNDIPVDMDLHYWIFTPGSDTTFVNWKTPGSLTSFPFAELDIDDVDGYGPETITVGQFIASSQFIVDNYSRRIDSLPTPITESGAHIDVYRGSSLVLQLDVPTSGIEESYSWWWHVFNIDALGNISIVNQLVDIAYDDGDFSSQRPTRKPDPAD
ncbi:MAG: hypothetical protein Kow0074_13860 [Candidatus Zixiibacteriota bacterium]